jgi:hypothetical protein
LKIENKLTNKGEEAENEDDDDRLTNDSKSTFEFQNINFENYINEEVMKEKFRLEFYNYFYLGA